MNFDELKQFLDNCPHLIQITDDDIFEPSKIDVIAKNEICYMNTLTNQIFSIFSNEEKETLLYVALNYPDDWLQIKKENEEKFMTAIALQKEQIMEFNKKTFRKSL